MRWVKAKRWLMPLVVACGLAVVPCLLLLSANPSASGHVQLHWGWEANVFKQHGLLYGLQNFAVPGLWVALVWGALLKLPRQEEERGPIKTVLLTGMAWAGVVMMLQLSPWSWDNSKLLLWAVVIMLPAWAWGWQQLQSKQWLWFKSLLIMSLLLPGVLVFLSLWPNLSADHPGYSVTNQMQLNTVCSELAGITQRSRVAISPEFNHPVILCGQPVMMGFEPHLWSHGYGDKAHRVSQQLPLLYRQGKQRKTTQTSSSMSLLNDDVQWLWLGPNEQTQWGNLKHLRRGLNQRP
jgi:hypothetical protein